MKVAILGASGLLGSYLEFFFQFQPNWDVTSFSRVSPGGSRNHRGFATLEEVANLSCRGEFSVVINCVAMASHEGCELKTEEAFDINARFPGHLASLCSQSRTRLIHISTDAVFDGPHEKPFTEDDEPQPVSAYGRSKLKGEHLVQANNPDSLIVRTNFFAWSRTGNQGVLDFFFSALRTGRTVPGFTDYVTSSIYAGDLAQAMGDLIATDYSGVIHVVAANSMSKFDFGKNVADIFSFSSSLVEPSTLAVQSSMAHRAPELSLSPERLGLLLGRASPTTQEGLERAKSEMECFFDFVNRER